MMHIMSGSSDTCTVLIMQLSASHYVIAAFTVIGLESYSLFRLHVSLNETLSAAIKHELSSLMDVSAAKKKEKREYDEVRLSLEAFVIMCFSL